MIRAHLLCPGISKIAASNTSLEIPQTIAGKMGKSQSKEPSKGTPPLSSTSQKNTNNTKTNKPEKLAVNQKTDSGFANKPEQRENEARNKTEPTRDIETCKRCTRHYMPSQLNNSRVHMICGAYHPGTSHALGTE